MVDADRAVERHRAFVSAFYLAVAGDGVELSQLDPRAFAHGFHRIDREAGSAGGSAEDDLPAGERIARRQLLAHDYGHRVIVNGHDLTCTLSGAGDGCLTAGKARAIEEREPGRAGFLIDRAKPDAALHRKVVDLNAPCVLQAHDEVRRSVGPLDYEANARFAQARAAVQASDAPDERLTRERFHHGNEGAPQIG